MYYKLTTVMNCIIFFRIIEIAGGREVFCQSRTKALKKSRSEDKMAANRCKSKSPAHPGGIWELRTRFVKIFYLCFTYRLSFMQVNFGDLL